jgi:hypothetical protein
MMWRATAAEETRWMEQRTSKYSWWGRGNNNTDDNNKKQQSTNVQCQRQRTCAAAEAKDNDGWQEAGHSGGGGGATVVWWQRGHNFTIRPWRMEVDDQRAGRRGVGYSLFSFLGKVESYFQSYPL